jgi:putative ABC transport system ATP-binding protein
MSAETAPQNADERDQAAVSLSGVKFAYAGEKRTILDIPSFVVRRGERVFLSGQSGSGKSTLLSMIAGVLTPQEGSIAVDGVRLEGLSGAARDRFRADRIGYIFQRFNLVAYLSVIENALIPCNFSSLRRDRAKRTAKDIKSAAKALLERLDLPRSIWHIKASRLSTGEQQRVAAARALIGAPAVLIADEPTSALDMDRRERFLELLLGACADQGSSLVFVSHDLSLSSSFDRAERFCDLNGATDRR